MRKERGGKGGNFKMMGRDSRWRDAFDFLNFFCFVFTFVKLNGSGLNDYLSV